MRILVIEDDCLAGQALSWILEEDGHRVLTVEDGTTAAEVISAFDPDVVITDWRVPGLSGRQLCLELRRQKPSALMIVVSSAPEAFTSRIGVDARLRKPIDVTRLRKILSSSRVHTLDSHA